LFLFRFNKGLCCRGFLYSFIVKKELEADENKSIQFAFMGLIDKKNYLEVPYITVYVLETKKDRSFV
jgi:hypothetical protein